MWCKQSNMEAATHSPMMIHIPGKTDEGVVSRKLVELIDLFPTLVEATGFTPLETCQPKTKKLLCTEGSSMMKLIKRPTAKVWKKAVFSQFTQDGQTMGYSIRTNRYRYTEWVKFDSFYNIIYWNVVKARELYDHQEDADENENVVDQATYATMVAELSQRLRLGWRAALPKR